jgi:SAM-dependent methyltransferase
VLDVGCGNARFGRFLAKHLGRAVTYHGIDSSPALLARATEDLSGLPGLVFRLEERDIVEAPPDTGQYSLVTAFGLLHHIPGFQERRELVRALAERVAPGGVLAFTGWCFYEYERFRARIVDWPPDLTPERHDYLLDWRRGHAANTALRYCHYIDDAEHADLLAASGLVQIATFRADGHTGDINRYGVLRRAASNATHP